ncbi:ABC transporter substrate-binding protein [Malaciobacter molluscorum]|uniref:ABC transporter substrate-binding protein n=1 Tax=Malaciobacter molluscorum TaxID=1032072 RepID=UPI00100B99DF|nr:extracellular solute-binding protein [Malaciobacter molluscorum]RXJ93535.1 ABC transporter substrate-binding protein [Malaciobacter molluscorum]
MRVIKIFFLIFITIFFNSCNNENSTDKTKEQIITVLVPHLGGLISDPVKIEAKKIQKNKDVIIRVVTPSWDDTVSEIKESLTDPNINYDVFFLFSSWAGSILSNNSALEIPKWAKDKIHWDDVLPIYKKYIYSWNNKCYFLPYDGDNVIIYYRKDILENKEYQKKFKQIYHYDLKVPNTWQEYTNIAQFFNGWDWDNDGKIEHGLIGSRISNYGTMLLFFARAAAYAKYPEDNAFYFDINTMKPRINNPAFVKALKEYVNIMQYAPKEIINYSPFEVRQSFIAGDVALAIDWGDIGIMANNAKESVIKNKIGYAVLPGSNSVYNSKKQKWEKRFNKVTALTGNWIIVVNKNSKNKKLALDFATHMSSKELTQKLISKGWSGVNPSRVSHFYPTSYEEWNKSGFSKDEAIKYLKTIEKSLSNKNIITDIRIPGAELYYDALNIYLHKAIIKELSAQQALDIVYKQWEQITNNLGREKQIKLYKESINE